MLTHRAGRRLLTALAACALATTASPRQAHAFAEDICQIVMPNAPRQGKVLNCFDLHCNDDIEWGSIKSIRCTSRQVVQAALTTIEAVPVRGRSMIHFDVTYVIAQALGMSGPDAYWIAAYNQAADQGSYQAYDTKGTGIAAWTTLDISGVRRTNFPAGGTFFHYVPPTAVTDIAQKLDLATPAEAPLKHVRDWAFGERETLCRFGLASKPFTDAPGCFSLKEGLEAISFKIPYTSAVDSPGMLNQVPGGEVKLSEEPLPADVLPLIKMGVYLHAMGDRISHHACCDESPLKEQPDGKFAVTFGPKCTQGVHASLHALEVGHKLLPERTKLAVEMTYDELEAWLKKHPQWKKQTPVAVSRDEVVADVMDALRPEKAEARLKAYRKLWNNYKICGLPGDEAKKVCFEGTTAAR